MVQNQIETEFLELLRVLLRVAEANKDLPAGDDDRVLDAEGLALKCFFHAASMFAMSRGTVVQEIGANFFDPASVNVLGRATVESFLVFHHLFVSPDSEAERDLRYQSWLLADLLERQEFPDPSPNGRRLLQEERSQIEDVQSKIRANPRFAELTCKQQRRLLEEKDWRRGMSWTKIARTAGLSDVNARIFYRYLCSYAHAGSLSVRQLREAKSAEAQRSLLPATMKAVMIALANLIGSYCLVFPRSHAALDGDSRGSALVDTWVYVGSGGKR